MSLPNTDTRRIKRVGKQFTVEPLSRLNGFDVLLCNHCATTACDIRDMIRKTDHDTAVVKVMTCVGFTPILTFSVLRGLDRTIYNTVRIGKAWAERLEPGKVVAIADTVNKEIIEERVVLKVFHGTLGDVLAEHARFNHAILYEIKEKGLAIDAAPARLERILKNAYGTNIAAADRQATAIYLKRTEP